jgi:hypothetical protein
MHGAKRNKSQREYPFLRKQQKTSGEKMARIAASMEIERAPKNIDRVPTVAAYCAMMTTECGGLARAQDILQFLKDYSRVFRGADRRETPELRVALLRMSRACIKTHGAGVAAELLAAAAIAPRVDALLVQCLRETLDAAVRAKDDTAASEVLQHTVSRRKWERLATCATAAVFSVLFAAAASRFVYGSWP